MVLNIHRLTAIVFGLVMVLTMGVTDVQAQTVDPLLNGGFEQAGATDDKAYDWQDYGNGYTRMMPTDPHGGEWVIRINNSTLDGSGAYQRIDLNQTEKKPVFVGGFVRGRNITGGEGWQIGASLYAEIHMTDGSVAYWNSLANLGTYGWRWIGFNTGTLALVDKPISHIFVVPIVSNATGTADFDDIVVAEFEPYQSAVTIMFDDGETNTYTEAKPVLDEYGFKGTSAVVSGFVGNSGYMNRSQLRDLVQSGWEIVSHSMTHEDLTLMNDREAQRQLSYSKVFLERMTGATINNFAFPFGAYNANLLAWADTVYDSARAYELGDNPQGVFPYDVKVRSVVNSTTPDEVAEWIKQAQENGRWIVLTFHSIAETGDDQYHTTPEQYKKIIDVIANSGIDVVTYDEGLKKFGAVRTDEVLSETPEETTPPVEEETDETTPPPASDDEPETPSESEEETPTDTETDTTVDIGTTRTLIEQQRAELRAKIDATRAQFGL